MNRSTWSVMVTIAVVVFYLARDFYEGRSDTVEYHGEQFKMAKTYWSYEDYKDDPNNLDTNELSRIEKVMVDAPMGPVFGSREQFIHAMFSLRFPGYGCAMYGEKKQADGSTLSMFSVEIPQRAKDRYLVSRDTGSGFILVDDFTASSASNEITRVQLETTNLLYYDDKGFFRREHLITQ